MAHIEKRGAGRWRARYRAPDGRERSQTFDRKVDAQQWLAEALAAVAPFRADTFGASDGPMPEGVTEVDPW